MIGNFKIERPSTARDCLIENNFSFFKSVYLTTASFKFNTLSEFRTQQNWIDAIKSFSIFPVVRSKDVDDLSEDVILNTSNQDYQYFTSNGKYRWLFKYLFDYDFHQTISKYSGQDLKVIFVDVNDYVYATTPDGSIVQGFDTDLVNVKKLNAGQSQMPVWTGVQIELSDADELNLNGVVEKLDFNLNTRVVGVIQADIQNLNVTDATDIDFDVVADSLPVTGLTISSFNLDDDSATQTINNLTESPAGTYRLFNISPGITTGDIELDDDPYIASEPYSVGVVAVTISAVSVPSDTQLNFTVKTTAGNDPVTTLVIGDVTITDNFNGALSGTLNHVGSGNYQFTSTGGNLIDGDIDVSSASYLGSGTYEKSSVTINVLNAIDWSNPTSGVAQFWNLNTGGSAVASASIVTGNGFTGNAQRFSWDSGTPGTVNLFPDANTYPDRTNYIVRFKYRSDDTSVTLALGVDSDTISANTGNAIDFTSKTFTPASAPTTFNLFISLNTYFELDEVELDCFN